MTVIRRILIPLLIFLSIILILVQAYTTYQDTIAIREQETRELANLSEFFQGRLSSLESFATALAIEVANNAEIQEAFAAGDRERVIALTLPAYQRLDAEYDIPQHQFHLPPATSFVRLHQLDRFGDDLSGFRNTVVAANRTQKVVSGLEIGRAGLGIRGIAPVSYQGEHIGTVEFGLNVDQTLLNSVKQQFGVDWQILLRQDLADVAIFEGAIAGADGPLPNLFLQASTLSEPVFAPETAYQQALNGKYIFTNRIDREDRSVELFTFPITDFSGETLGVVEIVKDRSALAEAQTSSNLFFVLGTLGILLVTGLGTNFILRKTLHPIGELTNAAEDFASGDLSKRVAISSKDEIGQLAHTFNSMSAQMQELIGTLEGRVQERARDLFLAADVSRNISNIRALPELLSESVDLIQKRFTFYYTQIYLIDDRGENLILRAGTGEAGMQLLARQHQLPISERSVNGKAAVTKEPVLVADSRQDPLFRPNPFLPLTRSELAIPLLIGERVVGVLNVQSDQPGTFTEENLSALSVLAGQLAVAIDNAALFAERQQAVADLVPFRLGFERSPSAIFLTDVNGVITYINPAFTELYGFTEAEALGHNPRIIQSGLMTKEEYANFWQTLLRKEPVVGEIVNKRKDGRLIQVAINIVAILDESNTIVGFLSLQTDITDRKIAESALARSVAELNCLNDIGRKVEEQPPIPEFLEWAAQRIPAAMPHTEQCVAAVSLDKEIYGDAQAMVLPRHIVEGLRIGGELIGRLYIAYRDAKLTFVDEDSSFIGGIGRRISSYLESQKLLEQVRKRATEMQTVAQVGTAVAGSLDTAQLLQEVVDLTKERFGLYHAHIYLLDESGDTLVLTAGAGQAGRTMVAEGRRIPLQQEQSLVARAARLREGVIVNNVQAEPSFLPHPLLPNTRAELAVPLIAGENVLGVLDVQADKENYFTEEDINTQTTLATQVATALKNAQQFEQTQLALEELRELQQTFVREGWQSFFENREYEVQGFTAAGSEIKPILRNGRSQPGSFVTLEELSAEKTAVIKPIHLVGTNIGGLGVRLPENKKLTNQQQLLLDALTEEVSQALERARLSEQTQLALDETEKRTQELAILNEMGRAFTADFELNAIIASIVHYTQQLIDADDMYVALYNAALDEVDVRIFGEGEEAVRSALKRRGGNGITEYVIRSREPLLIGEDISTRAEELGFELFGRSSQSWLGVPMIVGDEIVGIIAVQDFDESYKFGMREVDLLTTVANQAAIAIQNTHLFNQTQSRARQEQILREVSARVNAAVDPESILRTAAQEVGRALGLETFVYLTDKKEPTEPSSTAVFTNGR